MLVGLVVIDAGLGREDHGSIPRNCIWEGNGRTYARTRPELWIVRPPFPMNQRVKTKKCSSVYVYFIQL
jgi:hypothetical protein